MDLHGLGRVPIILGAALLLIGTLFLLGHRFGLGHFRAIS